MLNCDDASYQAWWPGVHLQFHTVRRVTGDVGNVVYMDEYVGRFRLRFHAIVTVVVPGKAITWQFIKGVRLPGKLTLRLEDQAEGVALSHVVEVGFRGAGRVIDAVFASGSPANSQMRWTNTCGPNFRSYATCCVRGRQRPVTHSTKARSIRHRGIRLPASQQ